MLFGSLLGLVVGPLVIGFREYPWLAIPLVALAIVIIHPLMNRDVPSLLGTDMLRSPRTYIAVALFVAAALVAETSLKPFRDRFLAGQ
jgi:hypothetical protein